MQATMTKTKEMVQHLEPVNRILKEYNYDSTRLIPILQAVQEEYKYLSKDVISYVAAGLNVPPSRVYGVATFYAHFSLEPKGRHIIKLCDGTACHVKKSHGILNALLAKLELTQEKRTTSDLMFTVETVSCLGACGLAPVVLFDDTVYGQATPDQILELVDQTIAAEKAK